MPDREAGSQFGTSRTTESHRWHGGSSFSSREIIVSFSWVVDEDGMVAVGLEEDVPAPIAGIEQLRGELGGAP
jgi:hypothetical protein